MAIYASDYDMSYDYVYDMTTSSDYEFIIIIASNSAVDDESVLMYCTTTVLYLLHDCCTATGAVLVSIIELLECYAYAVRTLSHIDYRTTLGIYRIYI